MKNKKEQQNVIHLIERGSGTTHSFFKAGDSAAGVLPLCIVGIAAGRPLTISSFIS
jgi:hypothetical protein